MAKGIRFQPQSSNPLPNPTDLGLWINNSNELVLEQGGTIQNITQVINNVESGVAVQYIASEYTNNTGSPIPAFSPVYSPVAGEIELADGTNSSKYRIIGITLETIADGATGMVAKSGTISGITGYTHNTYLYLALTAGTLTDVGPTLGPYPAGFNILRLGVIEGNDLHLQIQHMGVL